MPSLFLPLTKKLFMLFVGSVANKTQSSYSLISWPYLNNKNKTMVATLIKSQEDSLHLDLAGSLFPSKISTAKTARYWSTAQFHRSWTKRKTIVQIYCKLVGINWFLPGSLFNFECRPFTFCHDMKTNVWIKFLINVQMYICTVFGVYCYILHNTHTLYALHTCWGI